MFVGLFTCLVVHRFNCVHLIVDHAVRLALALPKLSGHLLTGSNKILQWGPCLGPVIYD